MPHDITLIATIASGFGLALICGFIATKLRLPPLVGYLIAGVMIGPATPGYVGDIGLATQLAEIGVMLLMFGVGLHFSLDDLMAVKRIALPGAIVQILAATAMGAAIAHYWGWPPGAALVFGLCLSVASTVVLLRALEAKGLLKSVNGQIAIGWLVVEDLVMVLVLVLLPSLATLLKSFGNDTASATADPDIWRTIGLTLLKVSAFIALMLIVGKRLLPKMLWWVASTGSRELFTLSVVAAAVGVAFGAAKLFDVSFALGAFFAGMMLRESEFSHRAADESMPLRDAFAVLFFVSVGMLLDPQIIWQQPLKLFLVVLVVMLGKTVVAIAIVLIFRYPLNTALTVGASLAQIGEFSFILAGLGVSLGLMSSELQSLVLAAAIISIALNAALFALIEPLRQWILTRSDFARRLELRDDPLAQLPMSTEEKYLSGQVVLVGYGRVGRKIAESLTTDNLPFVVAEQNRERVESLREQGLKAVCGDASSPEVLIQAHIAKASMLVVAIPDSVDIHRMVEIARTLNPDIRVVIRSHNEEEATQLSAALGATVFVGEHELARGISNHIQSTLRTPLPAGSDRV